MPKYIISKEFDALEMEFKLTEKGGWDLLPWDKMEFHRTWKIGEYVIHVSTFHQDVPFIFDFLHINVFEID